MSLRGSIESLREDLHRLSLTSEIILRNIDRLEQQELGDSETHHAKKEEASAPTATDRDGTVIPLGCHVPFLMTGRNKSKGGFVVRFSRKKGTCFCCWRILPRNRTCTSQRTRSHLWSLQWNLIIRIPPHKRRTILRLTVTTTMILVGVTTTTILQEDNRTPSN